MLKTHYTLFKVMTDTQGTTYTGSATGKKNKQKKKTWKGSRSLQAEWNLSTEVGQAFTYTQEKKIRCYFKLSVIT